ncbi:MULTISPECIES: hypothetical protein [Agrobacterium]|uniref:Uncharacterized protein n=1 Tax=Agrobacterium tumefaciens TaxID=358 RepID=A0AAE6BBS5_AGRTU|nr:MULTISPECIES: hypothetical protein [Agrobacterium]QCL73403.1 hypothetical protein CFBP5499_08225 [Agrobacterium tumefaciens]QCL78975.1 hypothetical protein CFBP5877_07755 [Agrobacterium tumefaciens]CUX42375.1 conserved hypothetical protein [Agrobacterium sp. NCPPB 925]
MTPETILEHDGIQQPIIEWALDYGITTGIIIGRLERGLSIADAITTPMKTGHQRQRLPIFSKEQVNAKPEAVAEKHTANGETKTTAEWAAYIGVSKSTLSKWLKKLTIEQAIAHGEKTKTSRPNALHTYDGQSKTLTEWAADIGIETSALYNRLRTMTLAEALTASFPKGRVAKLYTINGESKTFAEWCAAHGRVKSTVANLMKRRGLTLEEALNSHHFRQRKQPPGVSDDFPAYLGTGARSALENKPKIAFQKEAAE